MSRSDPKHAVSCQGGFLWGDDGTGCNGSDEVGDTPNAGGPNFGCPIFPSVSCGNDPNGDMFMNYMDYTNDARMFMFTASQVQRMQAALDGPRSSIGLQITGVSGQLLFYRDTTQNGTGDVANPSVIGQGGWQNFKFLFSGGNGIIYAVVA
jgi:hypothetical protein